MSYDIPTIEIDGREITGWSLSSCDRTLPHQAHTWDANYFRFGPYACPGVPDAQ